MVFRHASGLANYTAIVQHLDLYAIPGSTIPGEAKLVATNLPLLTALVQKSLAAVSESPIPRP